MAKLAIRMPKMSMTMTEGEVATWHVKIGDAVAEGDVVCEVLTDKVDMEVESTVAGTLTEIVVESGMAEVGAPIGWVEGEDTGGGFGDLLSEPEPEPEPAPDPAPVTAVAPEPVAPQESTPQPAPEQAPAPPPGPVPAVPRARGLAGEHGLDLAQITGTGADGLITVADVEARLTPANGSAPAAAVAVQAPAVATPAAAVPTPATGAGEQAPADPRRIAVRRAVARTMTASAAIPQFTLWREVNLDAADPRRQGASWTSVLLQEYAAALRQVPELLSRWEDDAPTAPQPPAVALAVATDRGLLVPVIAEPDTQPLASLDGRVRDVVRKAQGGKVDPEQMVPANASLSNLGGLGVDRFQALLTPPQASVLSVGSIRRRVVPVPGGVGSALTAVLGLTVDHRVADGAHGARVLDLIAGRLERAV